MSTNHSAVAGRSTPPVTIGENNTLHLILYAYNHPDKYGEEVTFTVNYGT